MLISIIQLLIVVLSSINTIDLELIQTLDLGGMSNKFIEVSFYY